MSAYPENWVSAITLNAPLAARLFDRGSQVLASSISYMLTDVTLGTSHTYTSIDYNSASGWSKTTPVTFALGHLYHLCVSALDVVGNAQQMCQTNEPGAGFAATSMIMNPTTASISLTPCSVSTVDSITNTRTITCAGAGLALAGSNVTLSGDRHGYDVGYVYQKANLGSAVIEGASGGQPVSTGAFDEGTTRVVPMRFATKDPFAENRTFSAPAVMQPLGIVSREVPATWDTSGAFLQMASAATSLYQSPGQVTPGTMACIDPTLDSSALGCVQDPALNKYTAMVKASASSQDLANEFRSRGGVVVRLVSQEFIALSMPLGEIAHLEEDARVDRVIRDVPQDYVDYVEGPGCGRTFTGLHGSDSVIEHGITVLTEEDSCAPTPIPKSLQLDPSVGCDPVVASPAGCIQQVINHSQTYQPNCGLGHYYHLHVSSKIGGFLGDDLAWMRSDEKYYYDKELDDCQGAFWDSWVLSNMKTWVGDGPHTWHSCAKSSGGNTMVEVPACPRYDAVEWGPQPSVIAFKTGYASTDRSVFITNLDCDVFFAQYSEVFANGAYTAADWSRHCIVANTLLEYKRNYGSPDWGGYAPGDNPHFAYALCDFPPPDPNPVVCNP